MILHCIGIFLLVLHVRYTRAALELSGDVAVDLADTTISSDTGLPMNYGARWLSDGNCATFNTRFVFFFYFFYFFFFLFYFIYIQYLCMITKSEQIDDDAFYERCAAFASLPRDVAIPSGVCSSNCNASGWDVSEVQNTKK